MKVLVIDDDPASTDMMEVMVKPFPSTVITANSGEEAILLAQNENPDLIILDLIMLDMDGLDICRSLRKLTRNPILMLSALYTPEMVAKALDAGADDYLSKPIQSEVLYAHMNSLMRRTKCQTPEFAAAGVNF